MPRQPQWLQHVPAALEQLERFPAPVVDRAALEKLLHVSRRDAIRLLHRFGGYQAGRTFLVGVPELRQALERVLVGEDYQHEALRRRRVSEAVVTAEKVLQTRSVRLSQTPLPHAAVHLSPGSLSITFQTASELLGYLYGIVQQAAADFEEFRERVEL